jgi:hypothetical protein
MTGALLILLGNWHLSAILTAETVKTSKSKLCEFECVGLLHYCLDFFFFICSGDLLILSLRLPSFFHPLACFNCGRTVSGQGWMCLNCSRPSPQAHYQTRKKALLLFTHLHILVHSRNHTGLEIRHPRFPPDCDLTYHCTPWRLNCLLYWIKMKCFSSYFAEFLCK